VGKELEMKELTLPSLVGGKIGHRCSHKGRGYRYSGSPHLILEFFGLQGYAAESVYGTNTEIFNVARDMGWQSCRISHCGRGDAPLLETSEEIEILAAIVAYFCGEMGISFIGVDEEVVDALSCSNS
jgi:hypothetical protein